MLLETLTLCDFGLFRGEHTVDLNPRKKYNSIRPIILFGAFNGAGKTTIFTAIRLAIYGKQSLGYAIGQKAYDEYLVSKVHSNLHSLVVPNCAHVALEFLYYKLGKPTRYKIIRSWTVSVKKAKETLTVLQDGKPIPECNQDQYQAFLNELIPLGVSDLFFFDGEKIASLAEDGGDVALRDAIRKLLGLDIIERLKSDLHIYIRRQNNEKLSEETKAQLENYESDYRELKVSIKAEEEESQQILPKLIAAKERLGRLEETLASKGGAWAVSRQSMKTRRDKIIDDKKILETEIREHLNNLYPLSLAPKLLRKLKEQLQQEATLKDWESIGQAVKQRLNLLDEVIAEFVPRQRSFEALQKINTIFSDLITRPAELKKVKFLHELSGKDHLQHESWINQSLSDVPSQTEAIRLQLNKLDDELNNVSLQIDRAPDEESLKKDLIAIKVKDKEITQLTTERNMHLEQARRYTWKAMDLVRRMRNLEEQLTSGESQNTGTSLASLSRDVLTDFTEEMTKRKIIKLEQEFTKTFTRLARKSDIIASAQINPRTFEVHLCSANGKSISKKNLSAGEKQIYAISMLEALAKTSGRKLPIIIDTPLGRLDSRHRGKLVKNYFSQASHQVIIFSTDTEVDKSLFEDLNKHVSHCYHVTYNESEGSSEINEGYFWKSVIPDNERGCADDGGYIHAS